MRKAEAEHMQEITHLQGNIFICSSAESVAVTEQIQVSYSRSSLKHRQDLEGWVFGPMKYTMEDLERVATADFAIAIVTGEDVVRSRKRQSFGPRDNKVFALGLFMGHIGRQRTFVVIPRGIKLKIPSDLLGLNPLYFLPPNDPKNASQWAATLGPVCPQNKMAISNLGPR